MHILVLANSYPTAATPSGAPYISARLRCMAARCDVEAEAFALRPVYSAPARAVRTVRGAATQSSLMLAPAAVEGATGVPPGAGWREAAVRWGLTDLLRVRRGDRPETAIARASERVLAMVGSGALTRPDVVHAHGMYAMPAGDVARRVARDLGVPFVVSLHGSDVEEVMSARARSLIDAATLHEAGATIYVSEALRRRAVGLGAPRVNSHVIPNGVDTECFTPTPSEPARVEPERAGAAGGAEGGTGRGRPAGPTLLYVGNLLPVKGVDRLPAIVETVARHRPGAHLVVAGDGPARGALASRLGDRVTLLGRVAQEEVARRMSSADVLLVPSRREGWGCVVTESYSIGTPVVASAVGGLVEAVLDDRALVRVGPAGGSGGSGGSAVTDGDEAGLAERFADRVLDVLDHPPTTEQMAAHVAGSSWESVVQRELDVLRGVVEAGA